MVSRLTSARAGVASLLLSTVFLAACGSSSSSPPPAAAPTATSVAPTSGPAAGGTAAVLTGTNFVAGATVTVGGTAATGVTVTSATAIAFTTPAHAAGAVDVVVQNPDGQSAALTGGFTYQAAATDQVWVVPDDAAALTTTPGGQVEDFTAGNLYVNAHTTAHAGGEIRGQLDNAGSDVRLASLNAAQENAAIVSTAFGAGILQVDTSATATRGKVRGFVITSGLVSITNAHVHQAARTTPPTPGGVVISLAPAGANKDMWVVPDDAPLLTEALITAFEAGNLYYNVHTAANTGGEIRGQLDKSGTIRLATLNGPQEAGSTSTAFGAGLISVDETTGAVAGFAVTTPFDTAVTNAHVHGPAPRGTNASPVVPMTFGPTLVVVPDAATALTTGAGSQTADFLAGNYYLNVHTTAHAGGEIRGQLDRTGDVRLAAMDGAQETPAAITTTAVGAGLVAVDSSSGQVSGFIVTRGLVSPTIAHIHQAPRGTGGSPIVNLAKQP